MGRIACDGMTMIRGAQEVNKMQGFYAPETKVIDLNADVNVRVHQLQSMNEEDLLAALGQKPSFIDAEFIEVEEPKRIASSTSK